MLHKPTRNFARSLLGLSLAAVLAGLSATPALAGACSSPSFTQPPIYLFGNDVRATAVADFDGDGRPDIVAADFGADNVRVLTKVARGVPATVNDYAVGHDPLAVAAADLNGDGRPDIITANNASANITVLLNDGAGGFGGPAGTFVVGASPTSIAVGDFNGDGKLDLAVTCSFSVVILLGDGQGSFGPPNSFQVGQQGPTYVTAADLNGDGKLDLAVATTGLAQILLGDGAGGFNLVTTSQCVQQRADNGIAVGDLNGDGKPDLVMADLLAAQIHVLLGNGTGCFGPSTDINDPDIFGSRPSYVTLGDLNRDGKLDFVAGNFYALGNGAGGFGPLGYVGNGGASSIADFDGDGLNDVLMSNFIVFGDGNGGFRNSLGGSVKNVFKAVRADLNGDGKPDIVALTNSGVTVMLGDGAGGFGQPASFPDDAAVGGLVVGDFNNDSKQDVAVLAAGNGTPHVSVLLGDGAGGLGPPIRSDAGSSAVQQAALAAGDFNGDGRLDVLTVNRAGGTNNEGCISVMLGDGAGGFSAPTLFSVNTSVNPGKVGVADFNGDGKVDLAVPSGGGFAILLGDGKGGFGPQQLYASAFADSVVVGDFNGDGRADLALAVPNNGNKVSVVFGDGAGNFGLASNFSTGGNPGDITVGDFNGDGRPDIAVVNNGQGASAPPSLPSVSLLLGDGAGGFGPALSVTTFPAGDIVAGDFNGDGTLDIATTISNSNLVSVLLNSCGASVTGPPTLQFSAPNYNVNEGAGSVTVTVTRTGSLSDGASVHYATSDGTASERSDYIAAYGTLRFAPGDSTKSFKVLVIDDARAVEGNESLNVTLSDPEGAVLGGTSSATVTIQDNDGTISSANPIDDPQFFVREHYYDFLNREPDSSGFQFWTNNITSCGADANCVAVKRVNVSAAFFLSIEFQETGYLVERTYKTAFGDTTSPNVPGTVPIIRLKEFLADTQEIGQGVVVGQGNWQQQLEDNKNAFALEFVQRPRFTAAFPSSLTADQFVSRLNANAGGVLTDADKSQLVDVFGGPSATSADASKRAQVLRAVAENAGLRQAEFDRAFVLMQYFGYLKRNPDDAPDSDFRGWKFWLDKLNQFNGNFVQAEMVKAFISSDEYRLRFNSPNGF
jgi:hypothetical protein